MPVDFRRRVPDLLSPEWQSGVTLRSMGTELAISARASSAPHLLHLSSFCVGCGSQFCFRFFCVVFFKLICQSCLDPPPCVSSSNGYLKVSLLPAEFSVDFGLLTSGV